MSLALKILTASLLIWVLSCGGRLETECLSFSGEGTSNTNVSQGTIGQKGEARIGIGEIDTNSDVSVLEGGDSTGDVSNIDDSDDDPFPFYSTDFDSNGLGVEGPVISGEKNNKSENVENVPSNVGEERQKSAVDSWFWSDEGFWGRDSISSSVKTLLFASILPLAPSFLLMTTSYVRISMVLFILRQGLGLGQIPSNQVISTLGIFLTFLTMTSVFTETYTTAIVPYSDGVISKEEAFDLGQKPIRNFMLKQIEKAGNVEMIGVFSKYVPEATVPKTYDEVLWRALAPAFLLSELKVAFLIGFQILLPFLVIDMLVSCVLVSTGMMMLPPAVVSIPFKLALFVAVDGWTIVVKSIMDSIVH